MRRKQQKRTLFPYDDDDEENDEDVSEEQILQMAKELQNGKKRGLMTLETGLFVIVAVLVAWNIYITVGNRTAPPQPLPPPPPPPPPPPEEVSNFPFILGFFAVAVVVIIGVVIYVISTASVFSVRLTGLVVIIVLSIIVLNFLSMALDVLNYRYFLSILGNMLIACLASLIAWFIYGNSVYALLVGLIYIVIAASQIAILPLMGIQDILEDNVMWTMVFFIPICVALGLFIALDSAFNFLSDYKLPIAFTFIVTAPILLWWYQLYLWTFVNKLTNEPPSKPWYQFW